MYRLLRDFLHKQQRQPYLFLEQPTDVINYTFQFLCSADLRCLACTCNTLARLIKVYFERIQIDFVFEPNHNYILGANNRVATRVPNSQWRQITGTFCFERGLFYWQFKAYLDYHDANDWKMCVGVATQPIESLEHLHFRWHGGNRVAFGMQLDTGGLVEGTSWGDTHEKDHSLKAPLARDRSKDLIGVALDMATDICTVEYYINHEFVGKHCFSRNILPQGKLWPIVACSGGASHSVEVLLRQDKLERF